MTTGTAWDVTTNPLKPTTDFDTNAKLDYPWDWSLECEAAGTTIFMHTEDFPEVDGQPENPMQVLNSINVESDTVRLVRVAVDQTKMTEEHYGLSYPVRGHVVYANGEEDDQTLWFKLRRL